MIFTFRGDKISLDKYCLTKNTKNEMEAVKDRFDFHKTTRDNFIIKSGQDLCHRYSFSAMQSLLCLIYNSGDHSKLEPLIATLFPYDDSDRQNADEVYDKIINDSPNAVEYFNQLLYILNNSLINLRPGNNSWNRSIGMCYDPVSWEYKDNKFIITNEIDIFILNNLLQIDVETSTIYFYTAADSKGSPVIYSSNNISANAGIGSYEKFNIPIFIRLPDGTEKQIT